MELNYNENFKPENILQGDIIFSKYSSAKSLLPITTSLFTEIEKIKNGFYKNEVDKARKLRAINKSEYSLFKENFLPALMFGLYLKGKGKKDFTPDDYTGLMPLDIDIEQDFAKSLETLKKLPFVVAAGYSVGGEALFAIIKCDPKKYIESFHSVCKKLNEVGVKIDESQKNTNRLRFVTYDPDIYFNPFATIVPILSSMKKRKKDLHDDGDEQLFMTIVEKKSEGNKIWEEGKRHNYLVKVITEANKFGITKDFCLEMCEKHCRPLMEDGLNFNIEIQVENIYINYKSQFGIYNNFWRLNHLNKIEIVSHKLNSFLADSGFGIYYTDGNKKNSILVKIKDYVCEEVDITKIGHFIKGYIENLPEEYSDIKNKLLEVFFKGAKTYLCEINLNLLNETKPDFLKDTKQNSYIPFRNGIVEISIEGPPRLLQLNEIGKVIWKSHIKNFDIKILSNYDDEFDEGDYSKFIRLATGNKQSLFEYAVSIIGHLIHRFKDPIKACAVILAEQCETENEGGGTGKSLLMSGIGHVRNVTKIDGKLFKFDKSFLFQRVSSETDIIYIEDCKKNIDFEAMYSIITDGLTVEKKFQQEVYIPFEESPKLVLSTNYVISTKGNHGIRRQIILEFQSFFKPQYTPRDYFGHQLFNEWNMLEWNNFYNFMFYCIDTYLKNGITKIERSTSNLRKGIRQIFGEEILPWWDIYSLKWQNEWKERETLYQDFLEDQNVVAWEYSSTKFARAIEEICMLLGFSFEKKKFRNHNNKTMIRIKKIQD